MRPSNDSTQLSRWLEDQAADIAKRWKAELRARGGRREDTTLDDLREAFLVTVVEMLGPAVGPWRDQVEPLLHQVATLYGSMGGLRGLATGEVVEEMQVLREILLRRLFRTEGIPGEYGGMGIRELLRLFRLVDQVVTHANVGHVDALFFSLLHGAGVTDRPGPEEEQRFWRELTALREELAILLGHHGVMTSGAEVQEAGGLR